MTNDLHHYLSAELTGADLQLLAATETESGAVSAPTAGVTASSAAEQTGAGTTPAAADGTGVTSHTAKARDAEDHAAKARDAENRAAEFDRLIHGEYKDLFDARMRDTIQKRLKNSQETIQRYEAFSPVLEKLASKYSIDPSDTERLAAAIEAESTEKKSAVPKNEEVSDHEQKIRVNTGRLYHTWMNQASKTAELYPGFNLSRELQNEKFRTILKSGADVRTAYEVVHQSEMIPAALHCAMRDTEKKLSHKLMSNDARPVENGSGAGVGATLGTGVSHLSKNDRDNIVSRVMRGEIIRF